MTVVNHRQVDKSFEIYLALYQGLFGNDDSANLYKQFSREFFDLIVIDECQRDSVNEDSSWREILSYFNKALLLQKFYAWSTEKVKFEEKQVKRVFQRMIEIGLVPKKFNPVASVS